MTEDFESQDARECDGRDARESSEKRASAALPSDVTIRRADPTNLLGVVRVLDGAALETDVEVIRRRLRADSPRVFVAVAEAVSSESSTDRVVAALALDPVRVSSLGDFEIQQVAVRRRRRGRGIGRALVEAACGFARKQAPPDATATVTASFDRTVRPFYETCGFEIADDPDLESGDGSRTDRLRARRRIDTRQPH
ncbi:GNAT family N-acetyltransferase [Halalkaliarchaeum sp. AArc-GB]|uniref:GNAT family N-acetyltransferase n=1 Tax=Halalkaliarchaeum sp. AArc-GB TaxID=3074078 RepID=UPI00285F8D4A|nr:GNAT family N-acetyltransferase [Halalkaliarchaeum sp. AArc-GB]MDR5673374.1 GNAT family N-acetyltransferase [Halalkaliarchaeum sp. AArc-GB]